MGLSEKRTVCMERTCLEEKEKLKKIEDIQLLLLATYFLFAFNICVQDG